MLSINSPEPVPAKGRGVGKPGQDEAGGLRPYIPHSSIARGLLERRRTHAPAPLPTAEWPHLTVEDAYAVQDSLVSQIRDVSGKHRGWKIGLTTEEKRVSFGGNEPVLGELLDSMEIPDGGVCQVDSMIDPRVEAEIGFLLGEGLYGPGVTARAVRSSLSHAVIALEIVDFRFDSPPTLPDLISDHALAAYFVVGSDVAIPEGAETVTLTSNDPDKSVVGTVAPGLESAFLHVAWLANALSLRERRLEPGDLILTGSVTPPIRVEDGLEVRAALKDSEASVSFKADTG